MNQIIEKLMVDASAGDLEAQFELAQHYAVGNGVIQNYVEAAKWYRKAADHDCADAQFELARCYDTGCGVLKNYGEAVKWYRRAAEQGHAEAQCDLGRCYTQGKGVKADYEEAERWFLCAADQGCFATKNDYAELNALLQRSYKEGTMKCKALEQLEKQCEAKKAAQHPRKKYTGPFTGLVNPLVELWDLIVSEDTNFFELVILTIIYVVIASVLLAVSILFLLFQIIHVLLVFEGVRGLVRGSRSR